MLTVGLVQRVCQSLHNEVGMLTWPGQTATSAGGEQTWYSGGYCAEGRTQRAVVLAAESGVRSAMKVCVAHRSAQLLQILSRPGPHHVTAVVICYESCFTRQADVLQQA